MLRIRFTAAAAVPPLFLSQLCGRKSMGETVMTKAELVDKITARVEALSKKSDAEEALNALVESLKEALLAGDSVILSGFGTFKVVSRAERKGHNPQSHEPIVIPARNVVKFTPAKALKEAVKES